MQQPDEQSIEEYSVEDLISHPRDKLTSLDTNRLSVTPAVALAGFLERLDVDERRTVLRLFNEEIASDILSEMEPDDSAEVVGAMREERAVKILEEFQPDDAADIVAEMEDHDRVRLLDKIEPDAAQAVKDLLTYSSDTAGGVMTSVVSTALDTMTVDQTISKVRENSDQDDDIYFIYVVDQNEILKGVVSLKKLILADPDEKMADIMDTQLTGMSYPEQDREEVALAMADHNLASLPVIDHDGKLLGIVMHDDVLDILQDEATEDIQKLVGAGADESIHDKLSYSVKKRNPWLQVNLITAFLAGGIVIMFEKQIGMMPLLAAFMPIIASLGGNAGHQTLAIAIRSLALGEVENSDHRNLFIKETSLGLINGFVIGIVAGVIGFVITSNKMVALVIFIAMILNMGLAGLFGAFIPLFLKKFNFDPAQSSSIFLTAVTDTAGFFIFLSLGSMFLL